MPETCEHCGAEINDSTQDCPVCGFRVLESKLRRKVAVLEEAIAGWRSVVERTPDRPTDDGHWEAILDDDGEMVHVRWSVSDDQGRYLWVRHYPADEWGRNACERQAEEWNRIGKRPILWI